MTLPCQPRDFAIRGYFLCLFIAANSMRLYLPLAASISAKLGPAGTGGGASTTGVGSVIGSGSGSRIGSGIGSTSGKGLYTGSGTTTGEGVGTAAGLTTFLITGLRFFITFFLGFGLTFFLGLMIGLGLTGGLGATTGAGFLTSSTMIGLGFSLVIEVQSSLKAATARCMTSEQANAIRIKCSDTFAGNEGCSIA